VQLGMLFPYGQILLFLSRSASSEWLSVGNPNTSSRGLLMLRVDFSHCIGAVNWVPAGPGVVRPGPGDDASCQCFVLVSGLLGRHWVGCGLFGSDAIDRIGPATRSRCGWSWTDKYQ
jgi:hypothetical protein